LLISHAANGCYLGVPHGKVFSTLDLQQTPQQSEIDQSAPANIIDAAENSTGRSNPCKSSTVSTGPGGITTPVALQESLLGQQGTS
jgi:hypothetical protein